MAQFLTFIHNPYGLLSILVVVLGLIFVVFLVLKSIQGIKQLTIGKLQLSNHEKDTFKIAVSNIIYKSTEKNNKIEKIKKGVKKSQLRQAREKIEEASHTMQTHFIRLLSEGKDIPFMETPDYKAFITIKETIVNYILNYIENRFNENEYYSFSPEAQAQYTEDRKKYIIRKVTEVLTVYWCCPKITRKELTEMNKVLMNYYANICLSLFNEAFAMSREGHRKIKDIEDNFNKYIEEKQLQI